MKRMIVILLSLAIGVSAMAQEVKKEEKKESNPFQFSGQAWAFTTSMNSIVKDETISYSALRFRPYFSYKTDNVDATVKLEIDQYFGGPSQYDASGKGNKGFADVGNDEKSVIEVKAAYLMFNIPVLKGLSIKGGVDEYKTPGGLVLGTEVPMGLISYKFDKNKIDLFAFKTYEGTSTKTNSDDAEMYGIDLSLYFGDIMIRPALYLDRVSKNADNGAVFKDSTAIIANLGFGFKMDALSIDGAVVYGNGKNKTTAPETKYSGYAADLQVKYDIQKGISAGAFFTYLSGDDPSTTDKNEGFYNFQLKYDGHGRMFLLEAKRTFDNMSDDEFADARNNPKNFAGGNTAGYMLFGGMLNAKIDVIEVKINLGYAQLAKVASGAEKDLGFEADLSISYEIEKNAKIIADFAYLAAGKAFDSIPAGKQNAIYAALGMQYKF